MKPSVVEPVGILEGGEGFPGRFTMVDPANLARPIAVGDGPCGVRVVTSHRAHRSGRSSLSQTGLRTRPGTSGWDRIFTASNAGFGLITPRRQSKSISLTDVHGGCV